MKRIYPSDSGNNSRSRGTRLFRLAYLLIAFSALTMTIACSDDDDDSSSGSSDEQAVENAGQTVIMYMPWSGNLLSAFETNIADMQTAITERGGLDDKRVMVLLAQSATSAYLMEMVYDGTTCSLDTIDTYTFSTPSYTTTYGLFSLFNDIITLAPADSYALIIGSHAMGWLPKGSDVEDDTSTKATAQEGCEIIETRYFGHYSDEDYQTDISTLADAIDMLGVEFDYILFDDCYMANIESVYELRNSAKYLIASACEVILYGMPYTTVGKSLLDMDLKSVCDDFCDYYSSTSTPYATLALIDCAEADAMAGVMQSINSQYDFDQSAIDSLQVLDGITPTIFFDFGDYVEHLCGTDADLYNDFLNELDLLVPYSRHTDKFYSAYNKRSTAIDTFSGISISAPSTHSLSTQYWSQTAWAAATE